MLTKKVLEQKINSQLEKAVDQPEKEIFLYGLSFRDWRLSYGIFRKGLFFLSIYPAFCLSNHFTVHYRKLSDMVSDVFFFVDFESEDSRIGLPDLIATVFSITRNKETIELFQDQKDLLDLGLKHYHLDNYYQDVIKSLCLEYYEKGTISGKKIDLTFLEML
jgi:hypothetical protein